VQVNPLPQQRRKLPRETKRSGLACCVGSRLEVYCGLACPMMNDSTPKQIAAVKAIVSKGSHVWI
jgi:hypothetical protein